MIPLGALDARQRRHLEAIIETCRENRGRPLYFRQIMKLADCPVRNLYSIIWNLRLSLDIDALCALRESFAIFDIEEPTLENAIRFVTNQRQGAIALVEDKTEEEQDSNIVIEEEIMLQEKILDRDKRSETRATASVTWIPNEAQSAAIEICRIMTSFDDNQIEQIKRAADALIKLSRGEK